MNRTMAILLAGGSGKRFGHNFAKQFSLIGQKTILEHCLERFESHPGIQGILLVENSDYHDRTMELINRNRYKKLVSVVSGGNSRQESSFIGVTAVNDDVENVLIHDVARPLIPETIINQLIDSLKRYPAVTPAIANSDTLIEVDRNSQISEIPDRMRIKRVQTPQAFKRHLIREAHELARLNQIKNSPDDCSLVLKQNLAAVHVVDGSELNIKVTYPLDLAIAREIVKRHSHEQAR